MKARKSTLRGTVIAVEVVETSIARHAQSIGYAVKHDFCHVVTLGLKLLKSLIVLLHDRRKAPSALHLEAAGLQIASETGMILERMKSCNLLSGLPIHPDPRVFQLVTRLVCS